MYGLLGFEVVGGDRVRIRVYDVGRIWVLVCF